jgi:lipoprotein-anchoring transpeptidase ErfK/SrfK
MTATRRPRLRAAAGLALVALAAAACGPAEASRGSSAEPAVGVALPVESNPTTPVTVDSTTTTEAPALAAASTTTTSAPDPHRTWIATAHDDVERLVAFDEPDGRALALPFLVPNPHQFGGPLTLMVTQGGPDDDWLEVQLPVRPNGQRGWIDAADYEVTETRLRAEVHLGAAQVRVFDGPDVIAESMAVVGAEDTPTPMGRFFVAAKKQNTPEEFWLGPWALVLSSYSEVLPSFSGGLPVIAIHGTNHPELMGEAITFGCVRVTNDVIEFLAEHVPVGAPVDIFA